MRPFAVLVVFFSIISVALCQETLRVACYNVEYGRSATPEQIGEMFKPYRLDVIGFCESPGGDWTARVGKTLGFPYHYVGNISSANHKDKYKSILSRFPLTDMREVELNVPQYKGWNPGSAVAANFMFAGRNISFYSTHLCNNRSLHDHAELLVDKALVNDRSEIVFVVGDFNCLCGDPGMKRFLDAGFRNSWAELGIDTTKMFTWNAQKAVENPQVIDHIVVRGNVRTKSTEAIEMQKPLADHKPVWGEFLMPGSSLK